MNAHAMDIQLPFDAVICGSDRYSVDDFLAISLSERVRLILSGALRFMDGFTEVERRIALQALRTVVARMSSASPRDTAKSPQG